MHKILYFLKRCCPKNKLMKPNSKLSLLNVDFFSLSSQNRASSFRLNNLVNYEDKEYFSLSGNNHFFIKT